MGTYLGTKSALGLGLVVVWWCSQPVSPGTSFQIASVVITRYPVVLQINLELLFRFRPPNSPSLPPVLLMDDVLDRHRL